MFFSGIDTQILKEHLFMISKKTTFNGLILLSMVSFGFFGSLSHLFNFFLLVFLFYCFQTTDKQLIKDRSHLALFVLLTSVFFFLLLRGVFSHGFFSSANSLSPMVAIPILGMLIVLQPKTKLYISTTELARGAQISVIFSFLIYVLLYSSSGYLSAKFSSLELFFYEDIFDRLALFSGNSIPFSTTSIGLSIMCLTNWKYSKARERAFTLVCFSLGIYLSVFQSGTRGTMLATIICFPFIIWHLRKSLVFLFSSIAALISFATITFFLLKIGLIHNRGIERAYEILSLISNGNNYDPSTLQRLILWKASISSVFEAPYLGHGIAERFTALSKNLPANFNHVFTHPHNDIFACIIGGGLFAGLLGLASLLSPFLIVFFRKETNDTQLFLGITLTITIFVTASVNTVFFNDITAAWLGFATFVIWALKDNSKKELKN